MFFPLKDQNPTSTTPWLTYLLIGLNVAAFLLSEWLASNGAFWFTHWYGMVPSRLTADPMGELITVVTSMFLHGGWYHLASNMWFMHVFADNLEDTLGRARFLRFYLMCGLVAAGAQILIDPHSPVPMVGASGAIAGIVGGYLVYYPRTPIVAVNTIPLLWLFTGIITIVPAWVIALIFFFSNLYSAYLVIGDVGGAGIAFFAHLGGFVAGFGLTRWHPDFAGRAASRRTRWQVASTGPKRRW